MSNCPGQRSRGACEGGGEARATIRPKGRSGSRRVSATVSGQHGGRDGILQFSLASRRASTLSPRRAIEFAILVISPRRRAGCNRARSPRNLDPVSRCYKRRETRKVPAIGLRAASAHSSPLGATRCGAVCSAEGQPGCSISTSSSADFTDWSAHSITLTGQWAEA